MLAMPLTVIGIFVAVVRELGARRITSRTNLPSTEEEAVSLGLPRALNNAAIAALIAAATAGKGPVDDDCVKKAVAEFTRD